MSSYEVIHNYFPNGDISPLWKGRSNTDFYNQSLAKCHNFMPLTSGGIRRRPGSYYIANMGSNKCALFKMNIKDNYFVVALQSAYIAIYNTASTGSAVFTSTLDSTHYPSLIFTDVSKIAYATNNNELWLVASDHAPVKIVLAINGSGSYEITVTTPSFVTNKDDSTQPSGIGDDPIFDDDNKYPSCIGFKDGRLFLGATNNNPNRIWASRSISTNNAATNYTNFYLMSGYDSGGAPVVNYNDGIMSEDNDLTCARWFLSHNRLIVGAPKAILMNSSATITPETFDITKISTEGTADIDACEVNGYILYAGANSKTLNMMIWDDDIQSYKTTCVSTASEHLFASGILDFTIAFMPEPVIWVITKDHSLLSGTVSTGDSISVSWALHEPQSGRTYEAILGIRRYDDTDRLFIITKNTSPYNTTQYLLEYLEMADIYGTEYNYMDCAITVTNTNTVIVPKCFEGTYFSVMATTNADNDKLSVLADKLVTIGTDCGYITVNGRSDGVPYAKICVGVPINSLVGFVSSELPANGQSSFGNKRRTSKVKLRIYNSYGGNVCITDSISEEIITRRYGTNKYGEAIELTEGDIDTFISGKNKTEGEVFVIANSPTPLNILAAKIKYELLEG